MKNLVKQFFITLLFSSLFLSCSKEELNPPVTESATSVDNTVIADPCAKCEEQTLRKTVGQEQVVGKVVICQTAKELKITFDLDESLGNLWLQHTGVSVLTSAPQSFNPSDFQHKTNHQNTKPTNYTYTLPLTAAPNTILYIVAGAVVPGPGGAGGQVWAGTSTPPNGNPNSRYFTYKVKECKPKDPPKHCLYPKDYWFKYKVEWPCKVHICKHYYSKYEVKDILYSYDPKTGVTDAKKAFIIASILKLNLCKNPKLYYYFKNIKDPKDPCYGILKHLKTIEDYFCKCDIKVTPYNINNTYKFPPSKEIRYAAEKIAKCIDAHRCDIKDQK
jgi:hypothetical protein